MTVILVLATFIVLLTIEYFTHRQREAEPVVQAVKAQPPRLRPEIVAGFAVPENLRFHPGHTWALSESPNLVRIGLDDFAARLAGSVQRIALPQRGQWVRQGQKIWTLYRDGVAADMVSPIEERPPEGPSTPLGAGGSHGWRRSTLQEVRRNITSASLVPVERNGRFELV